MVNVLWIFLRVRKILPHTLLLTQKRKISVRSFKIMPYKDTFQSFSDAYKN